MNPYRISFAITTHNEVDSLMRLINEIQAGMISTDEIVILDDCSTNAKTLELFKKLEEDGVHIFTRALEGDFALHKNYLKSKCRGEYIFHMDADELPSMMLLRQLNQILTHKAPAYALARVNTIDGITENYLKEWKWSINSDGWINWPDWQVRLYRNIDTIYYEGRVGETLRGFHDVMYLPRDKGFAILHPKHIATQIDQHEFFTHIQSLKSTT